MPIKLTYKDINDTMFMSGVAKLFKYENWNNAKVSYNVAKIQRRMKEEVTAAQDQYSKLIKKLAVLDENGNVKILDGGNFEIPTENEDAWKKAKDDFETVTFELDCHKIPMEYLNGVGLNAMELNALEPILVPVDISQGL